jgi:exosortase
MPFALVVIPFAALLWAYWPTLLDLARVWQHNPQYSHGYLVPVFAVALLWLRRDRLDVLTVRPNLTMGLCLLLLGVGLRLISAAYSYIWFDPISIIPCVAGLCLLLGGWGAWRWAWPSILFLGFMVPLPFRFDTMLSGPLQRLATIVSTFVMQMLGLPALAEGNVILVNDHQIGIVEACSGLRMLVVFFALSTALVLAIKRPWLDKCILLASAAPIALACNILRITLTGVLYETTNSEAANAFFHDAAGWLMMPLALCMLWLEMKLLGALFIETPASATRRLTQNAVRQHRQPTPRGPRKARPPVKRQKYVPPPRERPPQAEPTPEPEPTTQQS